MARPPMHGSVIVPDWHETVEGKEYLACILRKNRRREFGKHQPNPQPAGPWTSALLILPGAAETDPWDLPHSTSYHGGLLGAASLASSLRPPSPNFLKANSTNRARNMETAHPCQQQVSPEMLLTEPSLGVMPSAGHFEQQPCNLVLDRVLLCIQYSLPRPG